MADTSNAALMVQGTVYWAKIWWDKQARRILYR